MALSDSLDVYSSTYKKIVILGDFNVGIENNYMMLFWLETGLSDFHVMTLTVMKKGFQKFQRRAIRYRSYKYFSNEYFRKCFLQKLLKEILVNNGDGLQRFCDINIAKLNKYAPSKKKYACPMESNAFFDERFIESNNDKI